jgi:hypothetical protein
VGAWSLTEFLPADGNRDGIVDAVDYVMWRKNFGAVAPDGGDHGAAGPADIDVWRETFGSTDDLRSDANGDGRIDAADYVLLRRAGQAGAGQGGASQEPGVDDGAASSEEAAMEAAPTAGLANLRSLPIARATFAAGFPGRGAPQAEFFQATTRDHVAQDKALRLITAALDAESAGETDDATGLVPTIDRAEDRPGDDLDLIDRAFELDFGPPFSLPDW